MLLDYYNMMIDESKRKRDNKNITSIYHFHDSTKSTFVDESIDLVDLEYDDINNTSNLNNERNNDCKILLKKRC